MLPAANIHLKDDYSRICSARPGAALHPFDYELRKLGPYEIDIEVSHCGVCHSDVHLIDNDWNISHYPLVPDMKSSGQWEQLALKLSRPALANRSASDGNEGATCAARGV